MEGLAVRLKKSSSHSSAGHLSAGDSSENTRRLNGLRRSQSSSLLKPWDEDVDDKDIVMADDQQAALLDGQFKASTPSVLIQKATDIHQKDSDLLMKAYGVPL